MNARTHTHTHTTLTSLHTPVTPSLIHGTPSDAIPLDEAFAANSRGMQVSLTIQHTLQASAPVHIDHSSQ